MAVSYFVIAKYALGDLIVGADVERWRESCVKQKAAGLRMRRDLVFTRFTYLGIPQ